MCPTDDSSSPDTSGYQGLSLKTVSLSELNTCVMQSVLSYLRDIVIEIWEGGLPQHPLR